MENAPMTPREGWRLHLLGEHTNTGSKAGYLTARETLLHNANLLDGERCLVSLDVSGPDDNPFWVCITMMDGELTNDAQTVMKAMRDDAHYTKMGKNNDGTVSVKFYYHCLEEDD